MEDVKKEKVIAFDSYYTNNTLCILKTLCSYLGYELRPFLAIYIKFIEMQICMKQLQSMQGSGTNLAGLNLSKISEGIDWECFLTEISCYMKEEDREKMNQFKSMKNAMKMYQEFSDTMNLFQSVNPEFFTDFAKTSDSLNQECDHCESKEENNDTSASQSQEEYLKGLLSPEQKNMFDMLKEVMSSSNQT